VVGEPQGPLLVLLVVLAPLGALLASSPSDAPLPAPTAIAAAVAAGAVLAASLAQAVAVGVAVGVPEDRVLMVAVALVGVGALAGGRMAVASLAATLGVLALVVLAAGMASGGGLPWEVWARLASRPALVFSTTTQWVTEGRGLARATSLLVTETQRIVSVSGGAVRVMSPGPGGPTVRERRLAAGDAVTVRAGETLAVAAGTRLRFEAGKRVPELGEPGATSWAPRAWPPPSALRDALGLAVTLGGGAMALLGGPGRASRLGAVATPLLVLVFALGAVTWGLYAAWLTPDLAMGDSPLASIAAAPAAALPRQGPDEMAMIPALIAALLLLGVAASLTARIGDLVAPWAARRALVRLVPMLVAAGSTAAALAVVRDSADAGAVLRLGLGLAASAWAAPALIGGGRSAAVATLVGGGVFAALALATAAGGAGFSPLGDHPALAAAPLAALAGWLARGPGRTRGARRARSLRVGCPEQGTLPQ
jgi:hypothetical protein